MDARAPRVDAGQRRGHSYMMKLPHDWLSSLLAMRGVPMADLLVRNVDDCLVQRLCERAAAHGRSPEAEHREILAKALGGTKRKCFAEVLMSMPNAGEDSDFARS